MGKNKKRFYRVLLRSLTYVLNHTQSYLNTSSPSVPRATSVLYSLGAPLNGRGFLEGIKSNFLPSIIFMFRVHNGLPTAILTPPDCFHLVSAKPRTKIAVHHFFGNDVSLASLEHGSGDSCPHKDEFLWRQDVYWLLSKHVHLAWTCHSPHRWGPSSYSCVIWSSFIIDSVTQAFFSRVG